MSKERGHVRKGDLTRAAILDVALDVASRDGLEGVTIGILADRLDMSKSGVFSHFGSRDELLIEVLKEYETRFLSDILKPALALPRGLERLRAILSNWFQKLGQETEHGCLYISGAVEYDDRLIESLKEENIFRDFATVIKTGGERLNHEQFLSLNAPLVAAGD